MSRSNKRQQPTPEFVQLIEELRVRRLERSIAASQTASSVASSPVVDSSPASARIHPLAASTSQCDVAVMAPGCELDATSAFYRGLLAFLDESVDGTTSRALRSRCDRAS
jgi:hypothetical protein